MFVTGKLCDFTGLFAVTVLVCALMCHIRPAIALAGLVFAVLKVSPTAAVLAAPLLGGVTRQDLTDLIALMALWPAHLFLRRFEIPHGPGYGRTWLGVSGLAVAVMSITATSCLEPHVVESFEVRGDVMSSTPRSHEILTRRSLGSTTFAGR